MGLDQLGASKHTQGNTPRGTVFDEINNQTLCLMLKELQKISILLTHMSGVTLTSADIEGKDYAD